MTTPLEAQGTSRACQKSQLHSSPPKLVPGGALANPIDALILLFRGSSPAVVEEFARNDLYVRNGVVTKGRVREWTTVVDDGCGEGCGASFKPVVLLPLSRFFALAW